MGNGAICKKGKRFDKSVQMPPIPSTIPPSTSSSLSRSYKITPPPPVIVREKGFKVKQNAHQYSSIWDHNAQVSS
jgi:hypothetical protein